MVGAGTMEGGACRSSDAVRPAREAASAWDAPDETPMPRYFLNIRDNDALIADPDGDDIPDLDEARTLALEIIHDILGRPNVYGAPGPWQARSFEITDEAGTVLLTIPFASG